MRLGSHLTFRRDEWSRLPGETQNRQARPAGTILRGSTERSRRLTRRARAPGRSGAPSPGRQSSMVVPKMSLRSASSQARRSGVAGTVSEGSVALRSAIWRSYWARVTDPTVPAETRFYSRVLLGGCMLTRPRTCSLCRRPRSGVSRADVLLEARRALVTDPSPAPKSTTRSPSCTSARPMRIRTPEACRKFCARRTVRLGTTLTAWILLSTQLGSAHGEMSCGLIAIGALELREAVQAWATEGAAPTYSSPSWKRSAFGYTGSAATSLPES